MAAFAQSNEGDVSPNTKGPHCIDTGLPCDFNHSTCNGKVRTCICMYGHYSTHKTHLHVLYVHVHVCTCSRISKYACTCVYIRYTLVYLEVNAGLYLGRKGIIRHPCHSVMLPQCACVFQLVLFRGVVWILWAQTLRALSVSTPALLGR